MLADANILIISIAIFGLILVATFAAMVWADIEESDREDKEIEQWLAEGERHNG